MVDNKAVLIIAAAIVVAGLVIGGAILLAQERSPESRLLDVFAEESKAVERSVLTCEEEAVTPFTLIVLENEEPQLLTSSRIGDTEDELLCDGLSLNMGAESGAAGEVDIVVPVTNESEHPWRGSVEVVVGDRTISSDITEIEPGETETDTIRLTLDPGTLELEGSLVIGR